MGLTDEEIAEVRGYFERETRGDTSRTVREMAAAVLRLIDERRPTSGAIAEAERRGREDERQRIAAGLATRGWCSQRIAEAVDVIGSTTEAA